MVGVKGFLSKVIVFILLGGLPCALNSQMMDLSNSKIFCSEKKDPIVLKSISVLREEVAKRTQIDLAATSKWPKGNLPTIGIGLEGKLEKLPKEFQDVLGSMPKLGAEGYKIVVLEKSNSVVVVGKDARGVLYGIGKLMRKMDMFPGKVLLPSDLRIASSPQYPIRGHQLGYRPKTNSYDAFSVAQFDSYIRDMAIFGANSIEIMPPRTDDDFSNIHMKLPAIQMIAEQSRIADSYGMDVWMWYPNMGSDYSDPDSLKVEI